MTQELFLKEFDGEIDGVTIENNWFGPCPENQPVADSARFPGCSASLILDDGVSDVTVRHNSFSSGVSPRFTAGVGATGLRVQSNLGARPTAPAHRRPTSPPTSGSPAPAPARRPTASPTPASSRTLSPTTAWTFTSPRLGGSQRGSEQRLPAPHIDGEPRVTLRRRVGRAAVAVTRGAGPAGRGCARTCRRRPPPPWPPSRSGGRGRAGG